MDKETKEFFKSELTKQLAKQENKFERYVSVVAEQFEDQTAVVAEQYSTLEEKIEANSKKIDANTEGLNDVKAELKEVKETLAEHTLILKANQETLLQHDRQLVK